MCACVCGWVMKCHLLHLSIVTRAGSLVVSECWGSPQSTPLFIIFTFLLALFFYLLSPPYMHPLFLFSLLYFPFSLGMKGIEWKKVWFLSPSLYLSLLSHLAAVTIIQNALSFTTSWTVLLSSFLFFLSATCCCFPKLWHFLFMFFSLFLSLFFFVLLVVRHTELPLLLLFFKPTFSRPTSVTHRDNCSVDNYSLVNIMISLILTLLCIIKRRRYVRLDFWDQDIWLSPTVSRL